MNAGLTKIVSDQTPPMLARQTTWEEWERGRAARRVCSLAVTGGQPLRRLEGDPRKDALLKKLNNGARGLPFATLEELVKSSAPMRA